MSVRFLGRKVYLGAVVVLVSALRQGPSPTRVRVLHELFGVGERTLRRWRQWWQQVFTAGSFWRAARGRFMPSVVAGEWPRAVAERVHAELARSVAVRDDVIDGLYKQIFRELLSFMLEDPRTTTRALYLLFSAHNLERIGDHITNIAERVIFMASGIMKELNV